MASDEIRKALREPFKLSQLGFKPQSVKGNRAIALPYIDSRDVMNRLDDVVGVENWKDEYAVLPDGSVQCLLSIRIGDGWVSKSDVGSPSEQPDSGDRMKAAFSDALKRAAVKWDIGRYLYYIPTLWHDYDPQKRQFNGTPQLPAWAVPSAATQAKPPPVQNTGQAQPSATQPQVVNQQTAAPTVNPNSPAAAVAESRTAGELEAAVFAAKALREQGQLDNAGMGVVCDAVQSRVLHLVRDCVSLGQLDAVGDTYQKSILQVMNDKRRAAINEAFDAKRSQLTPQQQQQQQPEEDVDLFA